mgnify:FL=1
MKAEDYVTKWCDETYKGGKELGDWTTAEVMKFANDFSNEKLRLLAVSNSLPDFRDVIEARIKHFNSNYHTYEGSDLQNALNTIRRLVPPILFQIGQ